MATHNPIPEVENPPAACQHTRGVHDTTIGNRTMSNQMLQDTPVPQQPDATDTTLVQKISTAIDTVWDQVDAELPEASFEEREARVVELLRTHVRQLLTATEALVEECEAEGIDVTEQRTELEGHRKALEIRQHAIAKVIGKSR